MSRHSESFRLILAKSLMTARQLIENTGLSQPTVSRTLAALGDEVLRVGTGASIQYVIRDYLRGFGPVPVCRVSDAGQIMELGTLVPVRPDGFVMVQADGLAVYSDSLPWWMLDMRPQGFLGRAYASTHAASFGLSSNPEAWDDSAVVRVLLAHGDDAVGNLLIGELARDRFIQQSLPTPLADRMAAYPILAAAASIGDIPGSSAGGEQPKFCAYTEHGHVLVKFSIGDINPVTERWRDLLLAEHLALATLGIDSEVLDVNGQRFLEVPRFDRVGALGRIGMCSLKALEAEFVGNANAPWPVIVARLARDGHVQPEAEEGAALLWAFGILIGNTDMHTGNLSFVSSRGRPYRLAPAYDMLPMGFAPRHAGNLVNTLPPANLTLAINGKTWQQALGLARSFLERVRHSTSFSARFLPCVEALARHIEEASTRIARLA